MEQDPLNALVLPLAILFIAAAGCAVMAFRHLKDGLPKDLRALWDKGRHADVFEPMGIVWWRRFQVALAIYALGFVGLVIILALRFNA